MFFFTGYTFINLLVAVGVTLGLILANELTRRFKYVGIATFIALPILLVIFVWRVDPNSSSGTTFAWVKTFSALAGVIGFMAIRYIKKLSNNKIALLFPVAILTINILEAVYTELKYFAQGMANGGSFVSGGLTINVGAWNVLNAIAGIFLILSLTGWIGIKIARTKTQDMIWPDQLWFWIIAYDIWNFSYCYNCIPDRSFYAGMLLLISASVATFAIKRGAWLQHRATTLALWGMVSLTFAYGASPLFSIVSTSNPAATMLIGVLSIAINAVVLVFAAYKTIKAKKNPITNDIFKGMKIYKDILADNNLLVDSTIPADKIATNK